MSTMRDALEEYLVQRQNLGYKFQKQSIRLHQFVSFMEQRNADYISVSLALEWATQSPDHQPASAIFLSDIRGFSSFVRSLDLRNEVPPPGLIPSGGRRSPYPYTQKEIQKLLVAAKSLPPTQGLRRWTYHCLLGLLATTGMRISEALALRRDHVDLDKRVLTVERSKFGRSRLIPLHPSTTQILRQYEDKREEHLAVLTSPNFLVAEQGGRVWGQHVYPVFNSLCRQAGIIETATKNAPRLMDFRHSFAVATLLRWYHDGHDVESRLPVLSTFLGHTCIRDTYWYLSSCPELMGCAVTRLENRWRV